MEASTKAGVAGMVASDEVGWMPRLDEFDGEAAGHGSSRGWARSNAETKPRRTVATSCPEGLCSDGDEWRGGRRRLAARGNGGATR